MIKKFNRSNFFLISYTELWDRLNYYGLQSILMLYLTKHFGLCDQNSYEIYGICAALPFGLSILGGIIADKLVGFYYAALLGCLLIIMGDLILTIPTIKFVYLGLSIMVMGIGLLKPTNTNLLGDLYKNDPQKRDNAFSFFYLYINLGAIAGPLCYGILSTYFDYRSCFLFSTIGVSSALFSLYSLKKQLEIPPMTFTRWIPVAGLIISCISVVYFILCHSTLFGWILGIIFAIASYPFLHYLKKLTLEERESIYYIMLLTLGCIIFFTTLLQIYSSLLLFIDRNVNKNILGFHIPTTWFSAIEPCCIFLAAPLLTWHWKKRNISAENKVITGLAIASISFIFFSCAAIFANNMSSLAIVFIFFGNALLAASELCIIPTTISVINSHAPKNYKGTLMGGFYFSLILSGYLSSLVAQTAPTSHSEKGFIVFFFILATTLFLSMMLLFFINRIKNINYVENI